MGPTIETAAKDFQMPPELQRRPPRAIRRKSGAFGGCGLVFGRLFILPHMIIGLGLLFTVPLTIAEMFFGQVTQGQIIKKWTTSGKKTNYHIKYEYDVNGVHRSGERSCSQSEYDAIADPSRTQPPPSIEIRGLNIAGRYFHEAMLPDESRWGKIGFFMFFALFWNGVLSVFVYILWIAPWREKRLYRWGTPVPGRIYGKHTRSGKSTSYYLDYEFIQPQLGMLRKRQSVPSERYYKAHEGQLVTVLCYPHKTRTTVIYEYGDFECG